MYIFEKLTERIIGCSMTVFNTLGNGFLEVVYQRCLAIELTNAGLSFVREKEIPIFYKGKIVGTRRADFLIENVVIVELKAVFCLERIHTAQALNYLQAYNMDVGLLINFGAPSLQFKRLHRRIKDHQVNHVNHGSTA